MYKKIPSQPLVSICIPVYNGAKTIGKTIDSLLLQTYKNIEIIVVDNCSSDSTVQIVENYKDERIKIYQHDEYLQIGEYNWNRCFKYVQGEYMVIFHADDIYHHEIISKQIKAFQVFSKISAVFTMGNIINDNDDIVSSYSLPPSLFGNCPLSFEEVFSALLEYGNFFITSSAMMPTHVYQSLAPFRYDLFETASDLDMWIRTAKSGHILFIEEKLINYRFSVGSGVGSFAINHLRRTPDTKFKVLDYYLNNNNYDTRLPKKTTAKYELLRVKDSLYIANNCRKVGDIRNFFYILLSIRFVNALKILLIYPRFFIVQLIVYLRSLRKKENIIELVINSMKKTESS